MFGFCSVRNNCVAMRAGWQKCIFCNQIVEKSNGQGSDAEKWAGVKKSVEK